MGNYHPILMKFGTQTKENTLSSKITKAEAYGKTAKIKRKKRYRFKKATSYDCKVIKNQKFVIRWQKLPYSYNRRLGKKNRSLNFLIKLKLWCMRVFQASRVIEMTGVPAHFYSVPVDGSCRLRQQPKHADRISYRHHCEH
jgi:hypothetical protein